MEKKSQDFSMEDALRLAQSDAGKQLLGLMQAQNSQAVQQAMTQAAAGDYEQVKQTLSELLSSPQIRALLRQLGGQAHG